MVVAIVSWPGLARPPTTLIPSAPPVVDGRLKAGHDTMGRPARYFSAYGDTLGLMMKRRPCSARRFILIPVGRVPAMTVKQQPPGL
jgi:hypothetical protein